MMNRSKNTVFALLVLALALASAPLTAQPVRWSRHTPMPIENSEFGAARIGGSIYAVGGFEHENEHALLVYDPKADTWSRGPDLPIGIHHAGVAAIRGKLYVVAGGGVASDALQIFDPETSSWSQGAPLPTSRTAVATAILDGKMHVMGGSANIIFGRAETEHEVYDPATDTWETRAPMLFPSEHVFAGVIAGKIIVVGGRNNLSNISATQIYDPATDSWTQGAPMAQAVSGMAVGVVADKLYVYGGESISTGIGEQTSADDALQRYDPATDTWELLAPGPEGLHGIASAVVGNQIYFFGGAPIVASGEGTDFTLRLTVEGVVVEGLPRAPRGLKAKAKGKRKAKLRWKDKARDETGYEVEFRREDGAFERVASLGPNVRRVTISGLAPGARYTFRVRAINEAGPSPWSNEASATTRG